MTNKENTYNEHIEILRQAQIDDTLAIFVGAGISNSTNSEYKRWGEIIKELKTDFTDNEESDPLKVAQLYVLEYGQTKLRKKLISLFPKTDIPNKLQKLIFDINPHYVITTNWDKLLENSISENANICDYDVICSDRELVESSLKNKLIKMHGDFQHDKFVFTEDDYLNYSLNFPLIENYIKSIVSTHTILFLGYSFSDIDLKHIINWLQNNSNVRPPAYLTVSPEQYKKSEKRYLEKFGITILQMAESYDEFLEMVNPKIAMLNDIDEIDFLYDCLKSLSQLSALLRSQIKDKLSNYNFVYTDQSRAVLLFSEEKQKAYKEFVSILSSNNHHDKLEYIITTLKKADVHGIAVLSDIETKQEYYNFDKEEDVISYFDGSKLLDFDFFIDVPKNESIEYLFKSSFVFYNLGNYEDAFIQTNKIIQLCRKNKNYALLFVSLFNYNALLALLKYNLFSRNHIYSSYEMINLDEEFRKLPRNDQYNTQTVVNFLNFTSIYKSAFVINQELSKIERSVKIIKAGGFSLSSDATKYPADHSNLINFVLHNSIMVEKCLEYSSIIKTYVEISFNRQVQSDIIKLNKIEIYSCIKYFTNDELNKIFQYHLGYDDTNNTKKEFKLDDAIKDWLIRTTFSNCINYYKKSNVEFNIFEQYIENVLLILSYLQISNEDMKFIIEKMNDIIQNAKNTIPIFNALNIFFGRQFNLYKTNFDSRDIISLINGLIVKLIYRRTTGYEYISLAKNYLSNLFPYVEYLGNDKYSDEKLIGKLISEIDDDYYGVNDKLDLILNLLLNLYKISTDICKEKIKSYILAFDIKKVKNDDMKIIFKLSMLILEFQNDARQVALSLETRLNYYLTNNAFSSLLYQIDKQVEYLLAKYNDFKKSKELLSKLINRHKNNRMVSFI
jgi:hypothetical protein